MTLTTTLTPEGVAIVPGLGGASGVASWSVNCWFTFPPLSISCAINLGFTTRAAGTSGGSCTGNAATLTPVDGRVHAIIEGNGVPIGGTGSLASCAIAVEGLEHSHDPRGVVAGSNDGTERLIHGARGHW